MSVIKLLDAVNVNTVGDPFPGTGGSKNLTVFADNFGGGEVVLEISDDGGSHWVPVTFQSSPFSTTVNTSAYLEKVAQGQLIRATLQSATGASNVSAYLTE